MRAAAPAQAAIVGPTRFHPRYATKRAGDVILITADDRAHIGFYFRLSLLAELSNFFATLPPPASPEDLVNDTPLIPLHDITHGSLILLLDAVQSIGSPDLFALDPDSREFGGSSTLEAVMQATIAAKMYQIPVVHRVILEAIHSILHPRARNYYLEFVISAIAGMEASLPRLAEATLLPDQVHISEVSRTISAGAKAHALLPWCELHDLHARHAGLIPRLHEYLNRNPNMKKRRRVELEHEDCTRDGSSQPGAVAEELYQLYSRAKTVEEVRAIGKGNWGLTCPACIAAAELRYGVIEGWLKV